MDPNIQGDFQIYISVPLSFLNHSQPVNKDIVLLYYIAAVMHQFVIIALICNTCPNL